MSVYPLPTAVANCHPQDITPSLALAGAARRARTLVEETGSLAKLPPISRCFATTRLISVKRAAETGLDVSGSGLLLKKHHADFT